MNDLLLTARAVAEQLGVAPETVLRWTRRGELPGYRYRAARFATARATSTPGWPHGLPGWRAQATGSRQTPEPAPAGQGP